MSQSQDETAIECRKHLLTYGRYSYVGLPNFPALTSWIYFNSQNTHRLHSIQSYDLLLDCVVVGVVVSEGSFLLPEGDLGTVGNVSRSSHQIALAAPGKESLFRQDFFIALENLSRLSNTIDPTQILRDVDNDSEGNKRLIFRYPIFQPCSYISALENDNRRFPPPFDTKAVVEQLFDTHLFRPLQVKKHNGDTLACLSDLIGATVKVTFHVVFTSKGGMRFIVKKNNVLHLVEE